MPHSSLRFSILAAAVLLVPPPLVAQDGTRSQFAGRALTATPFLEDVYHLARINQLTDLRLGPSAGATAELRVWHGFGLWGVALYSLRLEHGAWHEYQLYPTQGDSLARLQRTDTLPTPVDRWSAGVRAGLLSLPPFPDRGVTNKVINDGYSAVLEWWNAGAYGVSGADNPDAFCSPDDRRILRVLGAILGPLTGRASCDIHAP
jgi:hypothetical protein